MEPLKHGELKAWAIQFVKYGLSGGFATLVYQSIFYTMAIFVLPALLADDPVVKHFKLSGFPNSMEGMIRVKRACINGTVAFLISNLVAYIINVKWVFRGGRHHWALEVALFYLVSSISFICGLGILIWQMLHFGVSTTLANISLMVTALFINYGMRKFVIFKG